MEANASWFESLQVRYCPKIPEQLVQDLAMMVNYLEVDCRDGNNVKKLLELAISHLSLA